MGIFRDDMPDFRTYCSCGECMLCAANEELLKVEAQRDAALAGDPGDMKVGEGVERWLRGFLDDSNTEAYNRSVAGYLLERWYE